MVGLEHRLQNADHPVQRPPLPAVVEFRVRGPQGLAGALYEFDCRGDLTHQGVQGAVVPGRDEGVRLVRRHGMESHSVPAELFLQGVQKVALGALVGVQLDQPGAVLPVEGAFPFHPPTVLLGRVIVLGRPHERCHVPLTVDPEVLYVEVGASDVEVGVVLAVFGRAGVDRVGRFVLVVDSEHPQAVRYLRLPVALHPLPVHGDERVLQDEALVLLAGAEVRFVAGVPAVADQVLVEQPHVTGVGHPPGDPVPDEGAGVHLGDLGHHPSGLGDDPHA